MMDRGLKFSTIHSFQGWDAANVIILLQPEGDGNGYTINSSLNKPSNIYGNNEIKAKYSNYK